MKKRPKNGIAKALMTPRFKLQVVKDKRRKSMIKQINKLLKEFIRECDE